MVYTYYVGDNQKAGTVTVLILVVMDGVHIQPRSNFLDLSKSVLILVVMDGVHIQR